MTLSELIDDVLLEARNSQITESEKLSRHQIELWIKTYRSMLIKQKLDKGEKLDDLFYQEIRMHLDRIEDDPGHIEFVGDKELPIILNSRLISSVLTVKDAYGNLIQVGSETKMKFQKYRKFTCKDYIAYIKDRKVYVEGDANQLEYIDVAVIAEDPTDEKTCYDPDKDEYPLPAYMWATVKQLIFDRDLRTMRLEVSDITNDSKDDIQNRYNPNIYRNRQYARV